MTSFDDTEELALMRASVRGLIARHCPPERIIAWEERDTIPRVLIDVMAEQGLLGLTVPEEYGGAGLGALAMVVVMEELAAAWQGVCALYNQSVGYGSLSIVSKGSEQQRHRFLPELLGGRMLCAYALSEPEVGADLTSVTTRAERVGDSVLLNGAKRWVSGADLADYMITLVRSGPLEERRRNLSLVMVPTRAEGVTLLRTPCMGTKGVATHDVMLDNVRIPFDLVLGEEDGWNRGWDMLAGPVLEIEKLVPTTIAFGTARAALDEAWEYSQTRRQFGKRICAHQSVRHMLVEARTNLEACRLMLYNAAARVDSGAPSAVETSMAKLFVAEQCKTIVLTCQQVMGAYGYAKGFQMERYVRDILAVPIYGGSSAIQRNNLASLLRLPKD